MGKKQCTQLAYFFNTASDILDTIGSMTENTIINSVKFDKSKNLKGGSPFGNDYSALVLRNKPPPALFPTRANLDKYRAVFPGPDFNPGHMLEVENDNENMFTSDYPKYPESHVLAENPNLLVQNKYVNLDTEGSSSDGSFDDYTTDDSIDKKEVDRKSSSSDENSYM